MGGYSERATDFGAVITDTWEATVWEATVWEATVWEATVSGPPISELCVRALGVGGYSELLKKSAN